MERRVYNFSPGPGMLPQEVLCQIKEELLDWHGCGMSVLEMSHRGKEFTSIIEEVEANLRELLCIPPSYHVLFLQGGGHLQFSMVPMNLLGDKHSADYVSTGYWSERAIADAQQYCGVNVAASSKATGYDRVPAREDWKWGRDSAFVHYVSNDTAAGVEFSWTPDSGDVPLVADMSTNILSKPVDVTRHALIYACAQKNIGVAGLTIVILRDDMVGHALPITPRMLDYRYHVENSSMFNTPCTFAVYVAGLVLKWIMRNGGLEKMERRHKDMAKKVYDFLDGSSLFTNKVLQRDRSRINIPFRLTRPELEPSFIRYTEENGLAHLRGNLALGLRASMYNAMEMQGVDRLIRIMGEFERLNA